MTQAKPSQPDSHLDPPRHWKGRFTIIWTGQAFSLLGSQLVQFALIWWLTEKPEISNMAVAIAAMAGILPVVFVGPIAGALVDRWNRRWVMVVADGIVALVTVGLIYASWQGILQPWHLYVALLFRGLGGAFHLPAMQASTSLLVPREHLSRVAGLNQMLSAVMYIVSPWLGAQLMGYLPLYQVLAVDVVTAALAILPLLVVKIPQPERESVTGILCVLRDIREGLLYIWHWPGLLWITLMAGAINFLLYPGYYALMPRLIHTHFHAGVTGFAWVNSVWGIGAVLGGVTIGLWGGFRRRIRTTLAGLIGIGIGFLMIGLSPANLLGLAIAGMFVAGVMNPITNGPLLAVVQGVVEPEIQGRIFTVILSVLTAMAPLGLGVAGALSDVWGLQFWFVFSGVCCVLMGIGGHFFPVIMHLEEGRPVH